MFKIKNTQPIIFVLLLTIFAVYMRTTDHPANFTPVGALSLFIGYYLRGRWKFVLPVIFMLASDFFLGFYEISVMISVYGSFTLMAFLGHFIKKYAGKLRSEKAFWVTIGSLAGSLSFYLITNAAVWYFTPWYEKTIDGLLLSYTLAIPFFRNTLFGDLFYTAVFFGAAEAVYYFVVQLQKRSFLNNNFQEVQDD